MPIIIYEGTALGTDAKRALAEKLTEVAHTTLGYPKEAITVVIHEAAAESIAIGGELLSERGQHSAPAEARTYSPSSRPSRPPGRPLSRSSERPSRPYERRSEGGRSEDRPARPYERRTEGGRPGDRPSRPYEKRAEGSKPEERSESKPPRKWEPREGEASTPPRKPPFRPSAKPGGSRPGPGRPTSRPSKPGRPGSSRGR